MNETLPDHITECIREYYKFPNDTADVDTLINLRRKLAGLKFGLSVSVGMLYKKKNATEYARKAEFYRTRQRLISEGARLRPKQRAKRRPTFWRLWMQSSKPTRNTGLLI